MKIKSTIIICCVIFGYSFTGCSNNTENTEQKERNIKIDAESKLQNYIYQKLDKNHCVPILTQYKGWKETTIGDKVTVDGNIKRFGDYVIDLDNVPDTIDTSSSIPTK